MRIKWYITPILLCPGLSFASTEMSHPDPIASVILWVTALFFFAILGRYIARRFNQPGVLGELLIGVLVGNVSYFLGSQLVVILREGSSIFLIMKQLLSGISLGQSVTTAIPDVRYAQQVLQALSAPQGTEYLKIAYVVDIFSRYGIIFLLFMVGLESSVDELKRTGGDALRVALIGVFAPMLLGFGVSCFLMPSLSYPADLFIAATLSATSIGITARVLSEMRKLRTREAGTILGAAMLDDVLGLILLSVVSSIVISGNVELGAILKIIGCSLLFFMAILWVGPYILGKAVYFFRFLEPWESKLFISVLFVMLLAWLASLIHLAAIIGAFAAGVMIHEGYFESGESYQKQERSIRHLVAPIESILAPMFFIAIGIQVKLETFFSWTVLSLAAALLVAAVLGKLASGLGANPRNDRLLIGIGMLPRGEVGLVFASIGRTLGVISDELFSAIVLMVLVTTFMAPPLLKARFARRRKRRLRLV